MKDDNQAKTFNIASKGSVFVTDASVELRFGGCRINSVRRFFLDDNKYASSAAVDEHVRNIGNRCSIELVIVGVDNDGGCTDTKFCCCKMF